MKKVYQRQFLTVRISEGYRHSPREIGYVYVQQCGIHRRARVAYGVVVVKWDSEPWTAKRERRARSATSGDWCGVAIVAELYHGHYAKRMNIVSYGGGVWWKWKKIGAS